MYSTTTGSNDSQSSQLSGIFTKRLLNEGCPKMTSRLHFLFEKTYGIIPMWNGYERTDPEWP